MHQEDGCQATATPPGLKYEEQGGPALRDLADVIRNFGDPRDVTSLLRRTTFTMAVVTESLDQVLAAIPATAGDARVLAVIREQAEQISRG